MRGPSFDIDATIDDLVKSLDDPEDYVRRALDNLHAEVRKEPNSRLTIDITSYGIYPNYKIDIPVELEKLDKQHKASLKVFSGRTHQELADPSSVRDEHWSAASTSLIELQALLRNLRKRKKPSGQARPIAE
jgi:hypothetical protein